MNAKPLLNRLAKVLSEHRLEAVMVVNAAAALHGAPVTTMDIDGTRAVPARFAAADSSTHSLMDCKALPAVSGSISEREK